MSNEATLIREAHFNPDIKKYILALGTLILFASIFGIPLIIIWLLVAPFYIQRLVKLSLSSYCV